MKFMYALIIMLVGMATSGEWQKPVGNLNITKAKVLTLDMIQKTDAHGYTVLIQSAYAANAKAMKILLDSKLYTANDLAQQNDYGESALLWAACNNDLVSVKMLIGTGFYDVQMLNQGDMNSNTPLQYAAYNENPEMAKIILNAGKFTPDDLEKKNANNESFYSYASKSPKMANIMSEAKAMAHKNTLATLTIVQSSIPMLKRGQ